jgi:hypothetical protein
LELSGIEELHEERFRVDRRKLEHMILGMTPFIKIGTVKIQRSK